MAWEIFESNAIQTLSYKQIPNFKSPAAKTALTSGDVICYLKTLLKELLFFTFGWEWDSKKLCHLHWYFQLNLASYVQRCVIDLPKIEGDPVFDQDTIIGKWRRLSLKDDEFFYILGGAKTKQAPAIQFGHLFVLEGWGYLGSLLGDFLDMRDKFKENLLKSEEVKQWD